ncbi:MAG: hypothetical protein IT430_09165 [Phycisphaerales bacterium]|nr:hypothetical protein [Phycisphaerales bacterium]
MRSRLQSTIKWGSAARVAEELHDWRAGSPLEFHDVTGVAMVPPRTPRSLQ